MKLSKKGKVVLALLIVVIVICAFLTYKILHFNNAIHDSSDNSKALKQVQKKIKNKDPISIAIFGVDSDVKRAKVNMGQRTDTLLIASVNPKNKKTKLISIPRDTNSKITGYGDREKIAHAYAYGGPKTAIDTIENNFDVPIDAYVTVDMDGFEKVIDILDGVNVKSNATFEYNGSKFQKGDSLHLNGKAALDYVRSRKEEGAGGDEGRTARQRQVIAAVSQSLSDSKSLIKLNKILKVSENNVKTNFNVADLKSLYSQYKGATQTIDKISINGENEVEDDGIWYFEPDINDKQQKMKAYKDNLK